MKLIGSTTSPYVRKVHVALLEKGIPFEFVNDSPWAPDNHVADFNPLGKVPALVADDGEVFFDSNLLCAYIENLSPTPALLPGDAMAALRVRQTVMLADGVVDAGVAIFLESRRTADKQDAGWIARQEGKLTRGLSALEQKLGAQAYFHGDALSLADIALVCCWSWLVFRNVGGDLAATYPALNALVARLSARPSFVKTVPVA